MILKLLLLILQLLLLLLLLLILQLLLLLLMMILKLLQLLKDRQEWGYTLTWIEGGGLTGLCACRHSGPLLFGCPDPYPCPVSLMHCMLVPVGVVPLLVCLCPLSVVSLRLPGMSADGPLPSRPCTRQTTCVVIYATRSRLGRDHTNGNPLICCPLLQIPQAFCVCAEAATREVLADTHLNNRWLVGAIELSWALLALAQGGPTNHGAMHGVANKGGILALFLQHCWFRGGADKPWMAGDRWQVGPLMQAQSPNPCAVAIVRIWAALFSVGSPLQQKRVQAEVCSI